MKPGFIRWATNDNHAAGADAWSGQPNKVTPASGKTATGRVPTELPPAEETNWWRWAAALILTACNSLRAANYTDADTAAAGTAGIGIGSLLQHVSYDPVTGYWAFSTNGAGANVCEEIYSRGGNVWLSDTPGGWAGASLTVGGYTINPTDGRRVASFQGADLLYYTAAAYPGAWAVWNGVGATGNAYHQIATDGALYVVWNATGSTLDYQVSPAAAGPPTAGATQPGFAGPTMTALVHNRHSALTVDPYDAGNAMWMALTTAESSTSTDGNTWTAASAHGIAAAAYTLEYTASTRRWHALDRSAANLQHYYSDDSGATWNAGTVIDTPANQVQAKLASDRFGTLVCISIDGTTFTTRVYASVDDGATWTEVTLPASIYNNGGATPLAGFGGGRFVLTLDDGAAPATYYPYLGLAAIDQ